MPGMKIFVSNSQRVLADRFAEVTTAAPPPPFVPETVLVLSRGMQRWLTLQLSERLGVCANFEFPFPAALVEKMLRAFVPEMPNPMPFTPEAMTWAIYRELPRLLGEKPKLFARIATYLTTSNDEIDELRAYQLSRRIADTFDHYQVYRREMVLAWEDEEALPDDENEAWQALLWRAIGERWSGMHLARCHSLFSERLLAADTLPEGLPRRISLFGISSLPPLQLTVLTAISRLAEVNLFINDPSGARWEKKAEGERNRLLESNDALLDEFVTLIESETPGLTVETELLFARPADDSLLGRTRAEVFDGDRRDSRAKQVKAPQGPEDMSVSVAACHSEMREIEALNDSLLEMFADPKLDLRADQVLVMIPDIELYEPYIRAVFDAPSDDDLNRRIPYTIADRSLRAQNLCANSIFQLMDLARGRFTASEVVGLLESEPVRHKFELADDDLSLIRSWLADTGVRWGIDDDDRQARGAGDLRQNSFRFGLDRLLLGYAMPLGEQATFGGILPFDDIEGDAVRVLSALLAFFRIVADARRSLAEKRNLADWLAVFDRLLAELFDTDDERTEAELREIRRCFLSPVQAAEAADFTGEVGLDIIRHEFAALVEGQRVDRGYLEGSVTFCSMVPMRSVPFKVICLVGMNDEAFPRQSQALGFDLMATAPQSGDRSRRLDDRFLFLESLMSAESRLYISYIGQSIEDNSPVVPSVLVSELLDYLNAGAGSLEVVRHRLQPFSPHYFTGADDPQRRLFSYSRRLCDASQRFAASRYSAQATEQPPFFEGELDEAPEEYLRPSIEQLVDFYTNPARFLIRQRLGIDLGENYSELKDSEEFDLDGLTGYKTDQRLLDAKLSGADLDDYYTVARATGSLPAEPLGVCRYESHVLGAELFAEKLADARQSGELAPLTLDLRSGAFRIEGALNEIYTAQMVLYRFGKRRPVDLLAAWIRHLALLGDGVDGYPRETLLIAKDKTTLLREPDNAAEILNELLDNYWRGLREPLPLLPASSCAYAESLLASQSKGKLSPEQLRTTARTTALAKAESEYRGGYNKRAEGEDAYIAFAWRGANPLDHPDFEPLAETIFGAVLASCEEV
jgi:exodeoxyribonuclease V gamma subunit